MIPSQNMKIVNVTPPGAIIDDAAVVTAAIDTLGFDYADVYVILGATDVAVAALKLTESDQAGSGYTDVEGGDFAGNLPGATDDNKIFGWHVDLKGKKRYLDVVATGGNGTTGAYITVIAILSRAKQSPNTAAKRGLAKELFV
jgi:hypothetical protein